MHEFFTETVIEKRKNVLADRVIDRLEDGTKVFNLKNTVLDHIRVNKFAKTRLVLYMSPGYSQTEIWVDPYESALDKITTVVNKATLEKGTAVEQVRIAMLGVDENNQQIRGSEREWEYQVAQ